MSVGIQDNKNLGVVKVTITTLPQLHPFSAATNAAQNYICYGLDTKGFQIEIDLQAMPPGVTLSQLQTDQVWWVEKRTSLYRLFLYAGTFDRIKNQVISTTPLPGGSVNATSLQGIPVLSGTPTAGQVLTYTTSGWSPVTASGGGSGGITQLTGDVTAGPGAGSQAATLASVGSAGTYGTASGIPVITTDAKGRVTSVTTVVPTATRVLNITANTATPSINTNNYNVVHITSQSVAITSFTTNLTGTPVDGQTLRISVTGSTAIALTWGTSFESSTATLPTTTVGTNRLDIGFFWNTETSKWRCVAVA